MSFSKGGKENSSNVDEQLMSENEVSKEKLPTQNLRAWPAGFFLSSLNGRTSEKSVLLLKILLH